MTVMHFLTASLPLDKIRPPRWKGAFFNYIGSGHAWRQQMSGMKFRSKVNQENQENQKLGQVSDHTEVVVRE